MACHQFSAKPFSKPMLGHCQLDHQEQNSLKFVLEFYHFQSRKCIWKCHLPEWQPFCPGGDQLKLIHWFRQWLVACLMSKLLPEPIVTTFSDFFMEIHQTFSFKILHGKMSSAKFWPFCLSLNVLKWQEIHFTCALTHWNLVSGDTYACEWIVSPFG